MTRLLHKLLLAATVAATTVSCSVNVPPPDLYSDPKAITNVSVARALLTSCYLLYPHLEYELSILSADFCPTSLSGKDVDQQNLYNWQDKQISRLATDTWLAYYNTIANVDVLLERMPAVKATTADDISRREAVIAEAKTLKALCYLQLLRLYAPAYDRNPDADGIVLKDKVGLEFPARSSLKDCAAYIRTLLTEAAAVDNAPKANGWLSQRAARYLLAELELYCGHYEEAAATACQLLDEAPSTALTTTAYSRLWETASFDGRIFAFNTSSTYYNGIEYDRNEGDYFALNPALLMTDGDHRKPLAEYTMDMGGTTRTLLGKYNRRNKENLTSSYINQMRYAGVLFIAAEALARSGDSRQARQLLNGYLQQMGATPVADDLEGDRLVSAILLEKQREFAGEGTNLFDLKRTHAALPRLTRWGTSTATTISATDYRWTWPLSASEYKYNEQVTQNEGWPINR